MNRKFDEITNMRIEALIDCHDFTSLHEVVDVAMSKFKTDSVPYSIELLLKSVQASGWKKAKHLRDEFYRQNPNDLKIDNAIQFVAVAKR